jgi:hypothetical protein
MLGPMRAFRGWIVGVFIFAFVVARVTGAHLHLCLDGAEPLAQLHVSDSADLDHHAIGQSHDDVDVDALGNVVAKIVKLDSSLNAMLAWVFAFGVLLPARQPAPAYPERPPGPPPRFFRPLLRGPPV